MSESDPGRVGETGGGDHGGQHGELTHWPKRSIVHAAPGDLAPGDGYRIVKHGGVLGVVLSLELWLSDRLAADAVVLREYGDSQENQGYAERDALLLSACCRYLNSGGRDLRLAERLQDLLAGISKLPFEFKLDPAWKLLSTLHEERVQHIYAHQDGRAVVVTEGESVANDLTAAQVLDWIEQAEGEPFVYDYGEEDTSDS